MKNSFIGDFIKVMKKNTTRNIISVLIFLIFVIIGVTVFVLKSFDIEYKYDDDKIVNKIEEVKNTETILETEKISEYTEIETEEETSKEESAETKISKKDALLAWDMDFTDGYVYKSKEFGEATNTKEVEDFELINDESIYNVKMDLKTSYKFVNAPRGYFDDALFIGDSRTNGLQLYAKIPGATYFTGTSLGFYNLDSYKIQIDGNEVTFLDFIATHKFNKVYFCMGINNLGADIGKHMAIYKQYIQLIKNLNKDVIIYIMANLHVDENRNATDKRINNKKIDAFNLLSTDFVNNEDVFYINPNILYDDENMNMDKKWTNDGTHLKAKYYIWWKDFITQNVIIK